MQQKAVAYYRVCYERAQQTRERVLSFAWIAYDVLAAVRLGNSLKETNFVPTQNPVYKMLRERISDYCEKNRTKFYSFVQFPNEEACYQLRLYTKHYRGLDCVMFIICEWAERNRLFSGRLQCHHICLILILFATGRITGSSDESRPFLEKMEDLDLRKSGPENIGDENLIELLVTFFEYLASRAFRKLHYISFTDLGYFSMFLRGEWLPLHEAAVRTYYNMVFNLQFEELNEKQMSDPLRSAIIRECEPFVIELPENFVGSVVENRILQKTGVEEVRLRKLDSRHEGRVSVLARGTLQSLRKLRNLVTIEPSTKTAAYGKEVSAQLSRLTYENIMR
ncbi:hypothetical protein KIN20_001309 [Parelaphostrongylus tenuis]|uniref:RNA-directed RNA polymerase n=1 Tax=Parelaphostrongylus tenuis TaxID=148309 RepID=A0AAD5QEG1_PARTN|nr:hypothetical protein KIN20_001309 [Parelaphostrongylus tenuis]